MGYHLEVSCPQALLLQVEPENRQTLLKVLEQDPRPAYQDDENRIYKMDFGRYTVSFRVEKEVLTVENIERLQK